MYIRICLGKEVYSNSSVSDADYCQMLLGKIRTIKFILSDLFCQFLHSLVDCLIFYVCGEFSDSFLVTMKLKMILTVSFYSITEHNFQLLLEAGSAPSTSVMTLGASHAPSTTPRS